MSSDRAVFYIWPTRDLPKLGVSSCSTPIIVVSAGFVYYTNCCNSTAECRFYIARQLGLSHNVLFIKSSKRPSVSRRRVGVRVAS